MEKIIPYKENKGNVRTISPETDKSCFFGYYDLKAYDDTDKYHLCNIADFEDRLPVSTDKLQLGVVDLETRKFEKIDETSSWNFQQGALLQWSRAEKDVVYYNVFENGEYFTVKKNVKTGNKTYAPVCANISRDGKFGLKIIFQRIYDFRPGYGYCNTKDPFFDVAQPENDGVFLVDIEKGTEKQILSYPDMVKLLGIPEFEFTKFVVNHITFNPKGDKFMLLLRNFYEQGKPWRTALIVSDLDGNMKLLYFGGCSHYDWINNDELFIYLLGQDFWDLFTVNVVTGELERIKNHQLENVDTHCLFSKDKSVFIGDCYPDNDGYRTIYRYSYNTDKYDVLVKSYSPSPTVPAGSDVRTDLHNRWNTKGDKISFDTIHHGKREIAELEYGNY